MNLSKQSILSWARCPSGLLASVMALVVLGFVCVAMARTRSLPVPDKTASAANEDFVDQFAYLIEEAPNASHGSYEYTANGGVFSSHIATLTSGHSIMIRYDLSVIPRGMRITNAELVMPVYYVSPPDTRFFVYRVLQEWGQGTSYKYRLQTPEKKVEWAMPGARAGSSDRATGATSNYRVKTAGKITLNVTSDVEMWYTKTAPNHGWLLTVEDQGAVVMFNSPLYHGSDPWVLRVTYEPE